jgi:hypothetical protein
MTERDDMIDRREAILRVSALLGGLTLVGGSALLTACEKRGASARADSSAGVGEFTAADIAFLDEVADTMLPETTTPGAKAARVGAFMALIVTDSYQPNDQTIFREGMREIDAASRRANGVAFMQATPQQRLALLERLDREQKAHTDARDAARKARSGKDTEKKADAFLPDQRKENAPGTDANPAPAITADAPTHYFRMMKELALLGYFTSEIGATKAMRYVESPGRFDPCVPYTPGERSWAPHA